MNIFADAFVKKGLITKSQIEAAEPKPVEPEPEPPKEPEIPKTYQQVFSEILFAESMNGFQHWHTKDDIPENLLDGDDTCIQHAFRVLLADPYRDKQVKLYYDFLMSYMKPEVVEAIGDLWKRLRYCPLNKVEITVKETIKRYTTKYPAFTIGELLFVQVVIMPPLILNICPSQTFFDKKDAMQKEFGKGYFDTLKFKFIEQRNQEFVSLWPMIGFMLIPYSKQAAKNTMEVIYKDVKTVLDKKENSNG